MHLRGSRIPHCGFCDLQVSPLYKVPVFGNLRQCSGITDPGPLAPSVLTCSGHATLIRKASTLCPHLLPSICWSYTECIHIPYAFLYLVCSLHLEAPQASCPHLQGCGEPMGLKMTGAEAGAAGARGVARSISPSPFCARSCPPPQQFSARPSPLHADLEPAGQGHTSLLP